MGSEELAKWGWIALGGALGALCRVWLGVGMLSLTGKTFWGTLVANLLGCFVMGALKAMVEHHALGSEAMRFFLFGGFVGAFTTFSTFMADGASLWREERALHATLYLGGSVIGGGVCFVLGWVLFSRLFAGGVAGSSNQRI